MSDYLLEQVSMSKTAHGLVKNGKEIRARGWHMAETMMGL